MPDIRGEMEAVNTSLTADGGSPSPTPETPTTPVVDSAVPAITGATDGTVTPPTDDDESTLPSVGAIPVDRVKKIIENARRKASAEVEGRFSWAKDLAPDQIRDQKQILDWLDSDPVGFTRFIENQLKSDPRHASHFTTPPREEADPEPQADLQLTDGTLTYSKGQFQKLFEWRERQLESKFSERLGPLEAFLKTETAKVTGLAKAQEVLADAKTWPGFSDSMNEIAELMHGDKRVTLESAYRRVVVPKLQQQDKDRRDVLRKEILHELKTKPAASTEVPGRVTTSTPESFKGKSTEDVMRAVLAEMGG